MQIMTKEFIHNIPRFTGVVDLSYSLNRKFLQRTYFVIRKDVVHFTKKKP